MLRAVDFSEKTIAFQWKYVNRNLQKMGVLDCFEKEVHRTVQAIIQKSIEEEFIEQIGAGKYERTESRISTRKGTYARFFTTVFGTSEVRIPRARDGKKITYSFFDSYQRRQERFDKMVCLSMILGLSTRKQKKFFESFIGEGVSHSSASRIIKGLEKEVTRFRTRPIKDKYKYLLVDGIWVHVKEDIIRKRPILFVLGVTTENEKEILVFKLLKGESEAEVTPVLNDLYRRGLEGKKLKVIGSDGAKGIKAAIEMVYPYAKWQLCSTHKLRNICNKIQYKKNRKELMQQASGIYKAKTKEESIRRFHKFCRRWEKEEPLTVKCLKEDYKSTIVYYEYKDDRNFISSTNNIERMLKEVRRRIRIQGYFKSERSVDCWVYGIISQLDNLFQPEGMTESNILLLNELEYESAQFS